MNLFNCFFFFFNDTATTEIYTLSLHDALPILPLPMSTPRFLRPTSKGVGILGLCPAALSPHSCQGGRTWFSFSEQTLSATYLFSSLSWQLNGNLTPGDTPYEAYAS